MIVEKLGVPDNIIESGNQLWNKTLNYVDGFYNVLIKKKVLNFNVFDIKIGEHKPKLVHVELNIQFYDREKPHLSGMSFVSELNRKQTNVKSMEFKESDTIKLIVNIYINESTKKKDFIDFLITEKIYIISSYAHELKHFYDYIKKPVRSTTSEIDYVDMVSLRTGSYSYDKFLYYLYLSHSVETDVKATEVATELKMSDIKKEDFEKFLLNNKTYIEYKTMSNYSLDLFLDELKEDIKESTKRYNFSDQRIEEIKNDFLESKLVDIIEHRVRDFNNHLRRIDPKILVRNEKDIDSVYKEIAKIADSYKKNPISFFENQIKFINFVGKKNIKKITKLYDYI